MTIDSQLDAYFSARPARYRSTQEESQMKHCHDDIEPIPPIPNKSDLHQQAYHWLLGEDIAPVDESSPGLAGLIRKQQADEARRIAEAVPWEALSSAEGCAGTSTADAPPFRPAWSGQRLGNMVGTIVGLGILVGGACWLFLR